MSIPSIHNSELPKPIPASVDRLVSQLSTFSPVVWVGAGASQAAGYPGTKKLLMEMRQVADDVLPTEGAFTVVVDAFIKSMGQAALDHVLEQQLAPPRAPTKFHRALARLVKAGIVRTVVTTNYDDLLERAFAEVNVHVTLQVMDSNFKVMPSHNTARLIKLHGDRSEWKKVILSGHSYAKFSERYAKLEQQLDLLRLQHAFLFVGCSMQDQRILKWMDDLGPDERKELKPWRPLMLDSEWQDFLKFSFEGRRSIEAIEGANLRPFIGADHEALLRLWDETATKLGATVDAVFVSPNDSPVLVTTPKPEKRAHGFNRAVWFSEDQSLYNREHAFKGNQDQKAKIDSVRGAYMRIIPSAWHEQKPDSLTVEKLNGDLRLQPLGGFRDGTSGLNEDGVLFRDLGRKGPDDIWRIKTATQWFEDNGEIWGFDGGVLENDQGEVLLAHVYLVGRWRMFLESSISTLRHLGARGPLLVEAGVAGLKGARWAGRFSFEKVSALKDTATVEDQFEDWSEAEQLRFVTKAFNEVLRAFGIQKISESQLQELR